MSLRAIGGRAAGPLIAVGDGWLVLQRAPAATDWIVVPTPSSPDGNGDTLDAVFAAGDGELFVGGTHTTLLHQP